MKDETRSKMFEDPGFELERGVWLRVYTAAVVAFIVANRESTDAYEAAVVTADQAIEHLWEIAPWDRRW